MATRLKDRRTRILGKPVPKAYLRLVERFLLRPIGNDPELDEALALADELFDRPNLLPEEQQYLDVLCDLIKAYEDLVCPIRDVSAAEMLRFLIDQRGVTQQTVAKETGVANSTLTALLKEGRPGGRDMTRRHIETFARYFGVEPAVFLSGN